MRPHQKILLSLSAHVRWPPGALRRPEAMIQLTNSSSPSAQEARRPLSRTSSNSASTTLSSALAPAPADAPASVPADAPEPPPAASAPGAPAPGGGLAA